MNQDKRHNSGGFGIVEVLLVTVSLAVAGLGMATLMNNLQKNENNVKYRTDADTMNEEIRAFLSDKNTCTRNFGGLVADSGASFPMTSLSDATGIHYQTGGTYGDRSISLAGMTFDGFSAGDSPNKAQMILRMDLASKKNSVGAQQVQRTINVGLNIDPATKKIINCISLSRMSDGIWQRSQGNLNNIFFSTPSTGGNVGIGTTSPADKLTVRGIASATAGIRLADGKLLASTPPVCTGSNALQWDGTNWQCRHIVIPSCPPSNGSSGSGGFQGGNQGNNGGRGGSEGRL